MASRGVLYVVWGQLDQALLDRAIASVREFHPELPVEIARLGDDATLLDKARMLKVCQQPKRIPQKMTGFLVAFMFLVATVALVTWP